MKRAMPAMAALISFSCSRAPAPTVAQEPTPAQVEAAMEHPPAVGPVGRYQLLAATHQIVSKKAQYEEKDVFRIDTVTGDTELLQSGDGKDFWSPIK